MRNLLVDAPSLIKRPLFYVFEDLKLSHKENTLWLEFGVYRGGTINYISQFTSKSVYGFDSFRGLPERWRDGYEKGHFDMGGYAPRAFPNVQLIQGWFQDVLPEFLLQHNQKISFIHIDSDLYSSAKFVLDSVKNYLDTGCVIVFDELANFVGYDGEASELRAFYEFVTENEVEYEWIGTEKFAYALFIHVLKPFHF
jgi:hypothetical protein